MSDQKLAQPYKISNLIPEDVWDQFIEFANKDVLCEKLDLNSPALRHLVELWYRKGELWIAQYEYDQRHEEDEEFEENDD